MNQDLYLIIGSIIVLSILGAFIPQIKGFIGEKVVANVLNSLPKNEYKVLNNIMLNTERGSTQIDHVVVSEFGIFVIETKNYKGIITGSEFSDKWTKNMYGKNIHFTIH